ncbi:MAG: TetR/AcrR family transcriptional regulator [Pseudobdellovibrionaceae bacterium]
MEKLTRKEQKAQTKQTLIQIAEKTFAEKGIFATNTAEIAKSCGLSHGSLFVHFPTRDDLLLAVVDQFGERLSMALGEKCSSKQDLKEQLRSHLSVLADHEDFYMRLVSESLMLPKQIRSQFYALNSSLSYRFYSAAKSGMLAGEYKKIDQPHFVNTWLSLIQYYVVNRDLFSEKTPILKHRGEDLIKHFMNLIKK